MAAGLLHLPSEVLESMIIYLSDHPLSIAAVSKTCKALYVLIYNGTDHHLWREIFLSRYDDPRLSDHLHLLPFDNHLWRQAYTLPAVTEEHLKDVREMSSNMGKWMGMSHRQFASALDALATLSATALPPAPMQQDRKYLAHQKTLSDAFNATKDVEEHCVRDDGISVSLNIRRLQEISVGGHFLPLLKWLSVPYKKDLSKETQAACKLLAFLGVINTTRPASESCPFGDKLNTTTLTHARKRVYNMDYPVRERMYGPFIRHRLRKYTPDWIQLAAIRLLCESAIHVEDIRAGTHILQQLSALDRLRPGAWSGVLSPSERNEDGESLSNVQRDWAGVEGVWRQFVVWLGYPTLLDYNIDMSQDDLAKDNICWITVPVRFRIVSYEDDPGGSPLFPIIHYEGEIAGQGWDPEGEIHAEDNVHPMEGTVSLLSDGSVRWSATSYEDSRKTVKQWHSEGVQIGGIGSKAGVLGMWTGAYHEDDDPIGGWWRWRVA